MKILQFALIDKISISNEVIFSANVKGIIKLTLTCRFRKKVRSCADAKNSKIDIFQIYYHIQSSDTVYDILYIINVMDVERSL